MFKNKVVLVTGGTGSFGMAMLKRCLESECSEVRIFSRDEKKQDDLRSQISDPRLKCFLGDVRDAQSIVPAMVGVDYVFHAAALKQVPSCEFFPLEAVKTNINGTENVLSVAVNMGIERVIVLSTDKAVYPVNAMGMSKAMMEKVALAKARSSTKTIINVTRYGNVLASRGSVVPLFIDQIRNNIPITITNPNMSRFLMTISDAIDLVLYAFTHGTQGEIFVQKSPSSTIRQIAQSVERLMEVQDYERVIIGVRHGEKQFETLISNEEAVTAIDRGDYYSITPDPRGLNYAKYVWRGIPESNLNYEFNSQNTYQLNDGEVLELLSRSSEVMDLINNVNQN